MKFLMYFLVFIITTVVLGFFTLFYPHIEVTTLTYQKENCSVTHSVPSKFQIESIGAQENKLLIKSCEEAKNIESMYDDLSSNAVEGHQVIVAKELRTYYKDVHFFYFENSDILSIVNVIENNTFVFEDLPHEYTSSFTLMKSVNHDIFFHKLKEVHNEILLTVRVKPNDDLEISFKYNNDPDERTTILKEQLVNQLSKSKIQKTY